jgi:HEAT repeat protein
VNALGVGGNLQAVPVLKQLASDRDSELARVAVSSLGRIGGDVAATALLEIGHDRIGRHIGDALLVAADKSQLSPAVLVQVCDAVYNKAAVSAQRLPAARLLALKSNGADRLRLLQVALSDDSAGLRRAAMQMLGEIPADVAAPLIDSLVKNCHGADKIMLLGVVEKVGGTRNLAVVRSSLKSDNPTVRAAACQTLGQIGDVSDVNLLLEQAGQDKAAAAALVRLHGSDVTARLIAGLKDADESHKILLVDVMAKRGDAEIGMPLLGLLDDPSSRVQLAAAKALSRVSDLHAFDKMLATLNDAAVSSSVRSALEMSVALAGTRLADKRSVVRTTAAYASADKSGQISLLRIMGRMQDKSFVTLLSAVAGGKDAELRDAAVRALARWKDPAAVDTIIKVASQITDERQNALLLIGVSRILKATRHSKKNMLPQYEAARKAARRDSERKLFELKGK